MFLSTATDIYFSSQTKCSCIITFLDKAAVVTELHDPRNTRKWRLCTVTQVEELKSFIRVLPIWASTIALSISFAQLSTFFITQSTTMDRKLGNHFLIPPGSVAVFAALNGLLLVLSTNPSSFPFSVASRATAVESLHSNVSVVGLFISIFAMASAAIIESKRRHNQNSLKMTVFWLLPSVFSDGAMFLSEIGIGSWLSTALVKIIERVTGGMEEGWLRNNLNESRLDKFYWVLWREESHAKVVDEGSVARGGDEEEVETKWMSEKRWWFVWIVWLCCLIRLCNDIF
ncbi:putative bacterial ABC-type protein transporter [Dioscorea sansibarensis]